MTKNEVVARLKTAGTAQNRKVYRRHGVLGDKYGVSYAELGKFTKQIKTDHDLAVQLWDTGNHDARILATMIADPAEMKAALLDSWSRDLDSYPLTDAFVVLVSKTDFAQKKMEKWAPAKSEWIAQAGWALLSHLAVKHTDLPDSFFLEHLETIEREIHSRKNRVRHSMNGALIAIGLRNPKLEQRALAAAAGIGKVEVDHGETNCKTPDAAAYIRKARKRKQPAL